MNRALFRRSLLVVKTYFNHKTDWEVPAVFVFKSLRPLRIDALWIQHSSPDARVLGLKMSVDCSATHGEDSATVRPQKKIDKSNVTAT